MAAEPGPVGQWGYRAAVDSMTRSELDHLVEEATVDCYDDAEQRAGLYTMIVDHLVVPFETVVLAMPVTVTEVDIDRCDRLVARCVRGAAEQWISLLDLPLPTPPPAGAEWIVAYQHWLMLGGCGE